MIVVGAVWVIVFNADVLLGLAMRVLGRIRALAPVLKISMAYPLANRFRTGTTLAMFTLVVFTLVTGTVSNGSFIHASQNEETFGGGSTSGRARAGRRRSPTSTRPSRTPPRSSPTSSRSRRPSRSCRSRPCRPVADESSSRTLCEGSTTRSSITRPSSWERLPRVRFVARGVEAVASQPNLAVVDSFVVPRRDNWSFGAPADFRLTGFYFDEGTFESVPVEVRDPQTGTTVELTVIGIPSETTCSEMSGSRPRRRRSRPPFRAAHIRRSSTSTSRPASSRATWPPGSSRPSSATGWRRSRSTR